MKKQVVVMSLVMAVFAIARFSQSPAMESIRAVDVLLLFAAGVLTGIGIAGAAMNRPARKRDRDLAIEPR